MGTPTRREIEEAVKAAESLRYWLRRIAERAARLLEARARALRYWK